MERFRIKNYRTMGYIVQERYWFFCWFTHAESLRVNKIFNTVEEAKQHIKESKNLRFKPKVTPYIEYVD